MSTSGGTAVYAGLVGADAERLDDEKLSLLRRWGQGLSSSGRDEEMRAAGRAVLLLVEEIDHLQRDLWHARAGVSDELPGEPSSQQPVPVAEASEARLPLVETLTRRLVEQLPSFP